MTNQQLLFRAGMNQHTLAEHLGVKVPYVSMYFTGKGNLPRYAWQKIYEFFLEQRCK